MAKLITVKDAVSDASMEIGISQRPVTAVVGTLDQDIAQMAALLSAVASEVLFDEPYEETLGDGNWLLYDDGSRGDRVLTDNDRILFNGRLAVEGLKYRFLKAKGLEFGEEMRDFITRLNKLAARANRRVLDLDDEVSIQQ